MMAGGGRGRTPLRAGRTWSPGRKWSGGSEDFGVVLGNLEQSQGCARRLAASLFPADGCDNGDVEHGSKDRLAHLQLGPQAFDFAGPDGRSGLWKRRRAQGDFTSAGHRIADILDAANQFMGIKGVGVLFHLWWCILISLTAARSRFFSSGVRSVMSPFV